MFTATQNLFDTKCMKTKKKKFVLSTMFIGLISISAKEQQIQEKKWLTPSLRLF